MSLGLAAASSSCSLGRRLFNEDSLGFRGTSNFVEVLDVRKDKVFFDFCLESFQQVT